MWWYKTLIVSQIYLYRFRSQQKLFDPLLMVDEFSGKFFEET